VNTNGSPGGPGPGPFPPADGERGDRPWLTQPTHGGERFGIVLALIAVIYLVATVFPATSWSRLLLVVLQSSTLVLALHTSNVHRLTYLVGMGLAVIAVVVAVVDGITSADVESRGVTELMGGILMALTLIAVLQRVVRDQRVKLDTIFGAVCSYLLIGMFFAFLFAFFGHSGQRYGASTDIHTVDYLIFSFQSLTGLGSGRLAPADNIVRTLQTVEAVVGQLFLVTLIARLVSLWGRVPQD
jgi:hypothetical protein